jgi:hypothetical protein
MIVYVESNFVLQLTWKQEAVAEAEEILDLARRKAVDLAIPAFALIEPSWTLNNRNKQRKRLLEEMSQHAHEIRRSESQGRIAGAISNAIEQLQPSVSVDTQRFEEVVTNVVREARVIAIDASTLEYALRNPYARSLRFLDAVVWATVRRDLDSQPRDEPKLFVTTNSKDFGTREIKDELKSVACGLVFTFADALAFIRHSHTQRPQ